MLRNLCTMHLWIGLEIYEINFKPPIIILERALLGILKLTIHLRVLLVQTNISSIAITIILILKNRVETARRTCSSSRTTMTSSRPTASSRSSDPSCPNSRWAMKQNPSRYPFLFYYSFHLLQQTEIHDLWPLICMNISRKTVLFHQQTIDDCPYLKS